MKAIIVSEQEFDLLVDQLKQTLTEAIDRARERNPDWSISKTVTYYAETFRSNMKKG